MERTGSVVRPLSDLAELARTDDSVVDGEMVWVRSVRAVYVYERHSGRQADGSVVVASRHADGVWVRDGAGGTTALRQPAWFVNAAIGSDANDGATEATALKTDAERQRRWGLVRRLVMPVTVTYLSDLPAGDPVNFDVRLSGAASLTVQGKPSVVASGAFTRVVPINRSVHQMQQVEDTGLVGGWSSHVFRAIRIPSGARAGACAIVAKDLSSGMARTTRWMVPDRTNGFASVSTAPAVGDSYEVLLLPHAYLGTVNAQAEVGGSQFVNVHNLSLEGFVDNNSSSFCGLSGRFIPIVVTSSLLNGMAFQAERLMVLASRLGSPELAPFFTQGGHTYVWSSLVSEAIYAAEGATVEFDKDTLVQANHHKWNCAINSRVDFGTCAFFDCTASSVVLVNGGVVRSLPLGDGIDLIWGTNNVRAFRVASRGALVYVTKPTVNDNQPLGAQLMVGGIEKTWSDIPFVDPVSQAGVILSVI